MGDDGISLALDEGAGDGDGVRQLVGGKLVHELHHELLHDGAETAGTCVTCQGFLGNGLQSLVLKGKLDVIQAEELHVLLYDGVLGLTEDTDEGVTIQVVEGHDHRQTAYQLGDQTELHDIVGNYILINTALCFILTPLVIYKSILQAVGRTFWSMVSGFTEIVGRAGLSIVVIALMSATMIAEDTGYVIMCFASPLAWLFGLLTIIGDYIMMARAFKRDSASGKE